MVRCLERHWMGSHSALRPRGKSQRFPVARISLTSRARRPKLSRWRNSIKSSASRPESTPRISSDKSRTGSGNTFFDEIWARPRFSTPGRPSRTVSRKMLSRADPSTERKLLKLSRGHHSILCMSVFERGHCRVRPLDVMHMHSPFHSLSDSNSSLRTSTLQNSYATLLLVILLVLLYRLLLHLLILRIFRCSLSWRGIYLFLRDDLFRPRLAFRFRLVRSFLRDRVRNLGYDIAAEVKGRIAVDCAFPVERISTSFVLRIGQNED